MPRAAYGKMIKFTLLVEYFIMSTGFLQTSRTDHSSSSEATKTALRQISVTSITNSPQLSTDQSSISASPERVSLQADLSSTSESPEMSLGQTATASKPAFAESHGDHSPTTKVPETSTLSVMLQKSSTYQATSESPPSLTTETVTILPPISPELFIDNPRKESSEKSTKRTTVLPLTSTESFTTLILKSEDTKTSSIQPVRELLTSASAGSPRDQSLTFKTPDILSTPSVASPPTSTKSSTDQSSSEPEVTASLHTSTRTLITSLPFTSIVSSAHHFLTSDATKTTSIQTDQASQPTNPESLTDHSLLSDASKTLLRQTAIASQLDTAESPRDKSSTSKAPNSASILPDTSTHSLTERTTDWSTSKSSENSSAQTVTELATTSRESSIDNPTNKSPKQSTKPTTALPFISTESSTKFILKSEGTINSSHPFRETSSDSAESASDQSTTFRNPDISSTLLIVLPPTSTESTDQSSTSESPGSVPAVTASPYTPTGTLITILPITSIDSSSTPPVTSTPSSPKITTGWSSSQSSEHLSAQTVTVLSTTSQELSIDNPTKESPEKSTKLITTLPFTSTESEDTKTSTAFKTADITSTLSGAPPLISTESSIDHTSTSPESVPTVTASPNISLKTYIGTLSFTSIKYSTHNFLTSKAAKTSLIQTDEASQPLNTNQFLKLESKKTSSIQTVRASLSTYAESTIDHSPTSKAPKTLSTPSVTSLPTSSGSSTDQSSTPASLERLSIQTESSTNLILKSETTKTSTKPVREVSSASAESLSDQPVAFKTPDITSTLLIVSPPTSTESTDKSSTSESPGSVPEVTESPYTPTGTLITVLPITSIESSPTPPVTSTPSSPELSEDRSSKSEAQESSTPSVKPSIFQEASKDFHLTSIPIKLKMPANQQSTSGLTSEFPSLRSTRTVSAGRQTSSKGVKVSAEQGKRQLEQPKHIAEWFMD